MNEAEKERLIKKDIKSIENRVRSAFNQGYEMGLKESRSENPNKWIPVSDRLPEKATKVLASWVYVPTGAKYIEVTERYGNDDDYFFIGDTDEYKMNRKDHKVIAWMPLPEPYKAESEEV